MTVQIKSDLRKVKQGNPPTAAQRQRRTQWDRLVKSLTTPQYTSIGSAQAFKEKPGVGVFATL